MGVVRRLDLEETVYNDLLKYFEENTVAQVVKDFGLNRHVVKKIKQDLREAKKGADGVIVSKPAQIAKQIAFYSTTMCQNSFE